MNRESMEDVLRSLDQRVGRIEQVLPTLATKDEIRNLATRDELARFATKEDMLAEGVRTRAHFDAVAERLESQLRMLAEGLMSLDRRFEDFRSETRRAASRHGRRACRQEVTDRVAPVAPVRTAPPWPRYRCARRAPSRIARMTA